MGSTGLGSTLAVGDLNGDGYADLTAGAPLHESSRGQAVIRLGAMRPPATLPILRDASLSGEQFGRAVAAAGDVNADGFADVVVGAFSYDGGGTDRGRAYLYRGSATGISTTPQIIGTGRAARDQFGRAVAGVGDVDNDGYADVLIGAPQNDIDNPGGVGMPGVQNLPGRAFLYKGGPSGLGATPALTLTGESGGDFFGASVAGIGDGNGDGYADFVVGAYRHDGSGADAGRV